jgi:tetratricopeptide (TPR) repeat protein
LTQTFPVPPLRFGEGARGRGLTLAVGAANLSPPAPLSAAERGEKTPTAFLAKLVLLLVLPILIGAHPLVSTDELIRQGNEAFASSDVELAESLYLQAEERAADPGLVAFNKGAALCRREDFRRAELCFRRALGDAAISSERRSKALYNLGNCLVRQAGDTDVRQLQSAIECYELALRESIDEGTRADAGHNLEVAKLLWAKARARRPASERDPDWDESPESKQPPRDPSKMPDTAGNDGKDEGPKKQDTGAKVEPGKGSDVGTTPKETPKPTPGQGNLPVLPDTDEVKSLAPEDAREMLKRAAIRINRERQQLRQDAAQGDRPRANDW